MKGMNKFIGIYLTLAAIVLLSSCARSSKGGTGNMQMSRNLKMASPRIMGTVEMNNMALESEDAAMPIMAEEAAFLDNGGGEGSSTGAVTQSAERKLVHTASLSLIVNDLNAAEKAALKEVENLGGYVAVSDRSDMTLNMDIKVPALRFDEAVTGVEGMGKLVNKNINVTDVTDRYYDLDSRIRTKKILKERLESYLKSSANMEDLIAVEKELNSVIGDLESMQGQFKRLSSQIDMCSISIRFSLPTGKSERGAKWPSVTGKMRTFIVGAAGFFSTLVLVVLGIALFGTPLVILAAYLYCLTFGKVGLVKKLFKKMKE